MQAKKNSPIAGASWARAGWRLFMLQPLGFVTLIFTYVIGVLLVSMLANLLARLILSTVIGLPEAVSGLISTMLVAVFIPGLSVGFMEACRYAVSKQTILPNLLILAFLKDRDTARNLLVLGVVYAIALGLILSIMTMMPEPIAPAAGSNDPPTLPPGMAGDVMTVLLLVTLVHLPVTMLMWYSPVLVAWHGMPPMKAMFFSLAAFLRNLGAFSIYGLVWAGWMIAASLIIGLLLGVFGLGGAGIYVVMPLLVPLIAALYCSFYASYTGVLVDNGSQVDNTLIDDTPPR